MQKGAGGYKRGQKAAEGYRRQEASVYLLLLGYRYYWYYRDSGIILHAVSNGGIPVLICTAHYRTPHTSRC